MKGAVLKIAVILIGLGTIFGSVASERNEDAAETLIIRYPDIHHPYYTQRDKYFREILKLALDKSGERYQLLPQDLPSYNEKRSVFFLLNHNYDVHWLNTSLEREVELRAIKFPLYKGAIGWRAFFIRPENQATFSKIEGTDGLAGMMAGQGEDWPDLNILRMNGLLVEALTSWEGMFKLTATKRIKYFPRSVIEIVQESKLELARELVIEKDLILKYPAAYYFFVRKQDEALATALEQGLNTALKDGSYDAVFDRYFGEDLRKLKLNKRRIISISNPELEASMPLSDERLWLRASQFKVAD